MHAGALKHIRTHTTSLSLSLLAQARKPKQTCMSYEEEDTRMSNEEEGTCMSYEEQDTCTS